MDPGLDGFVQRVVTAREQYRLPVQAGRLAEEFIHAALALLFPHFAGSLDARPATVRSEVEELRQRLHGFVAAEGKDGPAAARAAGAFLAELPAIAEALRLDAQATWEADPAAGTVDEVLLAYPGFLAIACHRVAHTLQRQGLGLLARLIAEFAHRETGIDIHPGARIGRSLAIDHGTGIVIGETTIIGDRVRLYQGVTLGALSVRKELAEKKRHPTIEDDVVIYANATILGGDTVIGAGSLIGGNVWLTRSVPPGSVVTHGAVVERTRASQEVILEFNI